MFGRNPKTLKVGQFILRRDSKAKSTNCPKGKFVPKHPVIKKANGLCEIAIFDRSSLRH